jgi:ATP-dependent 26S proteasome regulatory subunit
MEYDSCAKAMEVDERPTETYTDIDSLRSWLKLESFYRWSM